METEHDLLSFGKGIQLLLLLLLLPGGVIDGWGGSGWVLSRAADVASSRVAEAMGIIV